MARYERFFRLVAVGKMRDRMLEARCREFLTRLSAYGRCEVTVLPDADVTGEGRAMLREIDRERSAMTVVLTEEGREFTTREFAGVLEKSDRKMVFVIGGPFGIAPEVKARADLLLALSRMTFTHEMARMIFLEQLYRGMNLLNGGSYHH